ncbi:MAG: Plasma membrane t-SNARE, secretory vesicle fusion, partial [Pleopsidium flavum]
MSYEAYNTQGGYGQASQYDPRAGQSYTNQAAPQAGYGGRPQQGGYGNAHDVEQGRANGGYVGGNNFEMTPVNGQPGGYGQQMARDPNAILNECRDIDRGIDSIQRNLDRVRHLQQRSLDDPDASEETQTNRELDDLNSETRSLYFNFGARLKGIKQQPESGDPRNAPQVGKVDRKLKAALQQYQQVESEFRRKLQAAMERKYRIVRPDATEAEVRQACEDTANSQVFTQALFQSDRRGQSQSALRAVQDRHNAIQKVEHDMIVLAQLFQDLETIVVQQEPAVTQIEQKGEEVTDNVGKANTEIDGAITKARSRNRKKWW